MSLFKRLFGFGGNTSDAGEERPPTPEAVTEFQGYQIKAFPQQEGGQFRLYGTISKTLNDVECEYLLIRADMFPDKKEAAEAMLRKAKQVIREQGDRIFDDFLRSADNHLTNHQASPE